MEDKIRNYAQEIGAELKEKNGLWELSKLVAERKAFLSKKKLTYTAKFRINSDEKKVVLSEYLAEKGSGLSSGGGDFGSDMSPGFGFKTTSYKTGTSGISGSIQEQSDLFGKQYTYDFKYEAVRQKIETLALEAGFAFEYKVLPVGL
ncbi:hypothetical protein A3F37_00415 [Candidatus Saccharibacteria bacterium RIFCSPHIGHO2_12_FULL_41_12]|nr:MAG: hypothetical protein A3F37_00415 [Candidatus Saccharibacteria bacterium RIFCSPHIGHO2_12_FULL_41_12]